MSVGILTIGDELLSGTIQDSNTHFLAKVMFAFGVKPTLFRTCSDQDIAHALKEMFKEREVVITSGGLGNTHDDVTVQAVAEFMGVGLTDRVPATAHLLTNGAGEAPGFMIQDKVGHTVISFPGMPHELEEMALHHLPRLLGEVRKSEEEKVYSKTLHFCHTNEDHLAPLLSKLSLSCPEFQFGIYPKIGGVSVTFRGKAKNEEVFAQSSEAIIEALYEQFPTLVFPSKSGSICEAVLDELKARGQTLALAESCTGGEIAASLTKIPGASKVLLLSVVAYSDASKAKVLGVSKKSLQTHGPVSEEVVTEMIEGIFSLCDADYALAVSGIAGPDGGDAKKPVGTVWGAVAKRGEKIRTGLIPCRSSMPRQVIIQKSANYLLGALWRHLAYEICPFT